MQIFSHSSGFQLQSLPLPFSKLRVLNFQPVSGFFHRGIELIYFLPLLDFILFLFPLVFTSHPSAKILLKNSLLWSRYLSHLKNIFLGFQEWAEINMCDTHTFILFVFCTVCLWDSSLWFQPSLRDSHIVKSIIRYFLMLSNCWEFLSSSLFSFPLHSKYL